MTGINASILKSDLTNQWFTETDDSDFDYLDSPYALRLSDWASIGKYDESFVYTCANTDYCLRCWDNNKKLVCVKSEDIIHYSHSTTENKSPDPLMTEMLESNKDGNELFLEKHGADWRETYNRTHIEEGGLPMYFRDSGINEIHHRLLVYGVNVSSAISIANSVCNYPITGPSSKIRSVDDLDLSNVIKMRIKYNRVE